MTPPARTPGQRKRDALNRLDHDIDAWVATAGPANGTPHLVPLSFLWDGTIMLIATPAASVTSRIRLDLVHLGPGPRETSHAAKAPPQPAARTSYHRPPLRLRLFPWAWPGPLSPI